MNIQPLNDRIAVKQFKPSEISAGGIFVGEYVDDGFVKEIVTGQVVAVGPGMKNASGGRDSMWGISPGQIVRYSPVGSVTQELDGEEITFIRRDAVIGVDE
jgi:co-chaperonin GroES (HSP10)